MCTKISSSPASPRGLRKLTSAAVKRFAAHFHKAPDLISEQEFREYLLYLDDEPPPTLHLH